VNSYTTHLVLRCKEYAIVKSASDARGRAKAVYQPWLFRE
jgi:hypothetical protein